MLDDNNVLRQRDSERTVETTAEQYQQATLPVHVENGDHDGRAITRIVVAGMGGSALAAELAKTWLDDVLRIPFEVVRDYSLPNYVDFNTLVIASSCSGNTEETLNCLAQARERGAQIAVVAQSGTLLDIAMNNGIAYVILPQLQIQPRMLTIAQLRALTALLNHFGIISGDKFAEIADTADWLKTESLAWKGEITTDKNYAKQLALLAVGKTPVFYGGPLMRSAAYKWKISWNENAKNVAFWNQYPEFNHNEFMGWTSHPIEKPFVIFDLISQLEHPRIKKRFEISDRLLSGQRPKANTIMVQGDSLLQQLLWANVLADFTSVYVGILNNVDPGPVPLITKLKQELAKVAE